MREKTQEVLLIPFRLGVLGVPEPGEGAGSALPTPPPSPTPPPP